RRSRRLNRVAVALVATAVLAIPGLPASAHTTDPRLVPVIDREPLPHGVAIEVVPNVANELVVANSSSTPLVVIGRSGDPLLRIDRSGVEANFASPEWYVVNDPEGAATPPDGLRVGSAPRWALVSRGHSYGW